MASISPSPPHKLTFFHGYKSHSLRRPFYPLPRSLDSAPCRCASSSSGDIDRRRWDLALQDVLKNAIRRVDSYLNRHGKGERRDGGANGLVSERRQVGPEADESEDWDWDRWKKYFEQVEEQESLMSLLKSHLSEAVQREDYEDAARMKVAIAAAATSDTVGRVMSHLDRAVSEERFGDAASLRDNAGVGLVGWWAGISDDDSDPFGLIIRITPEYGRYVARSYTARQLATVRDGIPLFEVFLTVSENGEYKQQAVYLKRKGFLQDYPTMSSSTSGSSNLSRPSSPTEENGDLFVLRTEDEEDDKDTDDGSEAEVPSSLQNVLRDLIPGVEVKVLKVTSPVKSEKDFVSGVVEQIMEEDEEDEEDEEEEEEDKEDNDETENLDIEDKVKDESDQERDGIELDVGGDVVDNDARSEIAVKVVVGGLAQKLSGKFAIPESHRIPAKLEKKGRIAFSFSIDKDSNKQDSGINGIASVERKSKFQGERGIHNLMFDLAKFVGREKIPLKVLKDVGQLISLNIIQAQNHQPLSGSTTFHRIDMELSRDPLNGLYIGAHGLYSSEVIQLRRKFGKWKEDASTKEPSDLEFYEYVEATKLTGDPYVPAGQVAFRAKVGKGYQLPHKGIIPEEFGVIARYKGQGRLAEPGFQNPRWVDGELVVLDGKHIKEGPVVGFVYWAPEYHFLVFFNRLRLQP